MTKPDPTANLPWTKKLRLARRNLEHSLRNFFLLVLRWILIECNPRNDFSPIKNQKDSVQKILIIRTGKALGDALMSLSLVSECRRLFPNAQIHLLLRDNLAPFFADKTEADAVLTFHSHLLKKPLATWKMFRALQETNYDMVIACDNPRKSSFTTLCLCLLTGAPFKVGFNNAESEGFLNIPVASKPGKPMVSNLLRLLEPFGAPRAGARDTFGFGEASPTLFGRNHAEAPVRLRSQRTTARHSHSSTDENPWHPAEAGGSKTDFLLPKLKISSSLIQQAREMLDLKTKPILVFAASHWRKSWPLKSFLDLANELMKQNHSVVLAFGPDDSRIHDKQVRMWSDHSDGLGTILPPQKLDVFAAILSQSKLFVSNDCGPYHLAAASGTPCVGVFLSSEAMQEFGYQSGKLLAIHHPDLEKSEKMALKAALDLANKKD